MRYTKHLFVNFPTSLISNERKFCRRCGKSKSNFRHQKTSMTMMIKNTFDGATVFNRGFL